MKVVLYCGGLGTQQCYVSQAGRDWFTRDTFLAMLRLRGLECPLPARIRRGISRAEDLHGDEDAEIRHGAVQVRSNVYLRARTASASAG